MTLTDSAINISQMACKLRWMLSSREVHNCNCNSASCNAAFQEWSCCGISDSQLPWLFHIIDQQPEVVIKLHFCWLFRAWYDSCDIHVFQLVVKMEREVQAYHRYQTAGCWSSSYAHSFYVEGIEIKGENIMTLVSSVNYKSTWCWTLEWLQEFCLPHIQSKAWKGPIN